MLKDSQLDLCGRVDFARTTPLLARDEAFSFACAGCGGCCRGREDIVLSGFDLWRIAARLRLPPQTVARAFCRASIGPVSHLPVLRLAPVKEERNNCPFLTEDHCAIHDAEPLVCALYPLAQEISREGEVSYFLQPTGCGGSAYRGKGNQSAFFLRRRTMQAAVAPLNRVRASQPAEKLSPVVGLSSCLPSSGWSGWSG